VIPWYAWKRHIRIEIKLKGRCLKSENIPQIKEPLETANALVIGPGLGLHRDTKDALEEIIFTLKT